MLAVRLASPALSLGLAPPPVLTTRSTETSGSLCDSARMTDSPFRNRRRLTAGTLKRRFSPAGGRLARKVASGVVRAATVGAGLVSAAEAGLVSAAGAGLVSVGDFRSRPMMGACG